MFNRYQNAFLIESKDPNKAFDTVKKLANLRLNIENIWSDGKKHYFLVNASRRLTRREIDIINEVKNG